MKEAAYDEKKIGDEKTVVRKVICPVMFKCVRKQKKISRK